MEKFGYGYMATQVASTAAGVVELLNSGGCGFLERLVCHTCRTHRYIYSVPHAAIRLHVW